MRLWSLHPRYLDATGLVALWREALLARAVLANKTRGYRHHPQLARFRAHSRPLSAINAFLAEVLREADARGYAFDRRKVGPVRGECVLSVSTGQVEHEWRHLLAKLAVRSPVLYRRWRSVARPECHPLFRARPGPLEPWEKAYGAKRAGKR
jgi:hypothetical protein